MSLARVAPRPAARSRSMRQRQNASTRIARRHETGQSQPPAEPEAAGFSDEEARALFDYKLFNG